jgi:GNAT superfamily N-acetyltransferase
MEQWSLDLSNLKELETHPNIRPIYNPNYADLRREIMCFNEEIKWDGMWTFQDAQERLSKEWFFVGLFIDHQIKGWVWLDRTQTIRNLYVNKEYRGKGYGELLLHRISLMARDHGYEKITSFIDEWNQPSIKVVKKQNWTNEEI